MQFIWKCYFLRQKCIWSWDLRKVRIMSEFSRRDFVKSSLVTAGGIGISSSMVGSAWAQIRGANDDIRVAIAGLLLRWSFGSVSMLSGWWLKMGSKIRSGMKLWSEFWRVHSFGVNEVKIKTWAGKKEEAGGWSLWGFGRGMRNLNHFVMVTCGSLDCPIRLPRSATLRVKSILWLWI